MVIILDAIPFLRCVLVLAAIGFWKAECISTRGLGGMRDLAYSTSVADKKKKKNSLYSLSLLRICFLSTLSTAQLLPGGSKHL